MATIANDGNPLSLPFIHARKAVGDGYDSELGEFEAHAFPFLNRLYRTALILTGSPRFAKKLLDATFLQARRGYHRFQHDDDFGVWMFHILFDAFWLNRHRTEPRPVDSFNLDSNGKLSSDFLLGVSPKNTLFQYPFWEMTLPLVCA